MQLRKAERKRQHLRIALCSPPGAGKTYTALRMAHALGGPVGVVDTENGSAELYAGEANPDGGAFDFATIDLAAEPGKFSVDNYIKALRTMAAAGIRTVVVDSGSHAWAGEGGVLAYVDEVARKAKSGNKFTAWAEGTPKHNEWVQALLSYPGHLILTLRTKMEFVQEKNDKGRTEIRRVGLAPIQRDGIEYEFTVVGDLDVDTHRLTVTKSRCSALSDRSFVKPGADVARVLLEWLDGAAETPTVPDPTPDHASIAAEVAAERKEGHDPSWTDTERREFFGALQNTLKLNKDIAYALGPKSPQGMRPSQMTKLDRIAFYKWLQSNDGKLAYEAAKVEADMARETA